MQYYWIYILKSEKDNRYYIGQTQNLASRMWRHITGQVKSTQARRPLHCEYTELMFSRSEALQREVQIKSYKGGMALKKLFSKSSG